MAPHEISIAVAVASLIVIPALVAAGKRLVVMWREARIARLSKLFVLQEDIDVQFDTLHKIQAKQHVENRDFLDTIRSEAQQREGKILASIEAVSNQHREESRRLGTDVARVGTRVDTLFERLAEVKRQ